MVISSNEYPTSKEWNNARYWVTVPINKAGLDDVKYMRDYTPNLMEYPIPESEFDELWNAGIFNKINSKYGLLIDTYESEDIPLGACAGSLKILREANLEKGSVFAEALKQALNHGTFVECGF